MNRPPEQRGHPTTQADLAQAQQVVHDHVRNLESQATPLSEGQRRELADARAALGRMAQEGPVSAADANGGGLPSGSRDVDPQGTPKYQLKDGAPASGTAAPPGSGTDPGTQLPQPVSHPDASDSEAHFKKRQEENRYIRAHLEPREHPISKHVIIDKMDLHGLAMEKAALLADIVHDNDFMTTLVMGRVPSSPIANGDHVAAKNGHPARANVSSDTPTPILTSLHEIGHHVDDHLTWEKIEPVINAAKASSNVDLIKHLLSPEDIEYYTKPAELWARAYAQYIALRSGDSEAQAELQSVLNNSEFSWKQWDKSEWLPIEEAITNALQRSPSK